ncbi:unnamed protein product [Heterobilharzia americana]|nr:unnamed protein product [Heterobilharzia americana]
MKISHVEPLSCLVIGSVESPCWILDCHTWTNNIPCTFRLQKFFVLGETSVSMWNCSAYGIYASSPNSRLLRNHGDSRPLVCKRLPVTTQNHRVTRD